MTIESLIQQLNLNYPALASAKQKYEDGNIDACLQEIIRHFSTRQSPKYLFEKKDMVRLTDDRIIKEAEEILNGKIYGHHFKNGIDWMFNPTTGTSRDNEWSWSLYRHIYWQPLARAYAITGEEKYVCEFVAQLKSFSKAWSNGDYIHQFENYEKKFKFPGHAWRNIETAMRMYTAWIPCYMAFRSSSSWDQEAWIVFLSMLCIHGDHLLTNYTNHSRSSNWLTMESGALLQLGILFPEMKNADKWFETGYRRVMHELKYSFDNDGIHMERTPIYHMVASIVYLQSWRLCVKNSIPVPPYGLPTLEKAAEFIERLVKPDFTTPMIGDADRNDLLSRRSDTSRYEGMNLTFDPGDLNEMRAYFRTMHEITKRPDYLYFASGRKRGTPPVQRNYAMKQAGIYVMRTGWEKDDSFFHLHGVQLELGERSSHSHNDQCHLELHIQGEDILIDSGRYIYNSSCWKNWRHYFLSACAHNTVYIDDHEMGKVPGTSRIRGVRTHCHRFEEKEDYSIIDLSHNGYVFMDDPIFHRRRVIRLKGDIYIVDDQLTGLGKSEHDIRLYFNFAPGDLNKMEKNNYRYITPKGTEYNYISLLNEGIKSVMMKGSEEPIGGWVSYGYSIRNPIPQIYLSAKGPVPIRFVSVIAPKNVLCSGHGNMEEAVLVFTGQYEKKVILSGECIDFKEKDEQ